MNESEFKKIITHEKKSDNTVNYILCTGLIIMGFYFLMKIYNDFDPTKGNEVFLILPIPFILFCAGFYGLWRIPKDYFVSIVSSTQTISKKENLIDDYLKLSKHKIIWREKTDNIIDVRYRNIFWNYVDLKIYVDNDKFMFNAQGADLTSAKGIIDFGLTRRANNKLMNFLQDNS